VMQWHPSIILSELQKNERSWFNPYQGHITPASLKSLALPPSLSILGPRGATSKIPPCTYLYFTQKAPTQYNLTRVLHERPRFSMHLSLSPAFRRTYSVPTSPSSIGQSRRLGTTTPLNPKYCMDSAEVGMYMYITPPASFDVCFDVPFSP
jgi:hypothetical protein